ncbi:enamine deaminase RidA [Burkholderia sp. Nafp2/4-1b]|uniref:RidA family protein n=1 Tax=Burkholderia sp. Nafp2/4-1b TaxID=2116686 RepID=UPI000EF94685|nr:RidA family protein [Burkholderia sp. Nafp2/4-1b]RKU00053.1 enamine deaminase RidA [Burkholderia sp. Nafp2/4-1b]
MSKKTIVPVPGVSEKFDVPLSFVVKADKFLFVSGVPPIDHKTGALVRGDIETQTRASLSTIKYALESAGSSLDNVVKATIYITNSAYYKIVNDVYREFFSKDFPARTFVAMSSWPMEFDIEIECVALSGD